MRQARRKGAVFLVIALILPANSAICGMIDVEKPSAPLRIANWNMLERPGSKNRDDVQMPKASWRTTFGSERRSLPPVMPAAGVIDADVVLIQGLLSVREARKSFPARTWRLVVSRQILDNDDPLNPWAEEAFAEKPATAIAVRYQAALRVTGQEHLLELATADVAPAGGAETPAAGTAVRFSWGNKNFWALSVDLTSPCVKAAQSCRARRRLEAWTAEKLLESENVVTGGQWETPLSDFLPPPPCEARSLSFAATPEAGAGVVSRRVPDVLLGCLLRAELAH